MRDQHRAGSTGRLPLAGVPLAGVPLAGCRCTSHLAPLHLAPLHKLRVTVVSPGCVKTELADSVTSPVIKAQIQQAMAMAIPPDAIARAIAFAIEQPASVDVGDIVVRPTAQA